MRPLACLVALVATATSLAACRGKLDTHGMGLRGNLAPAVVHADDRTGLDVGAGVEASGPTLELEADPLSALGTLIHGSGASATGSPDVILEEITRTQGETKDELLQALDVQAKRIDALLEQGKVTPEEAENLRAQVDSSRKDVAGAATQAPEGPELGEVLVTAVGHFLKGNWLAAVLVVLAFVFRKFLARRVVGAGVKKVVDVVRGAIDAFDQKPMVASDGTEVYEERAMDAVLKAEKTNARVDQLEGTLRSAGVLKS
jgi:hypothetical protein